jgi:hypothetical protein
MAVVVVMMRLCEVCEYGDDCLCYSQGTTA